MRSDTSLPFLGYAPPTGSTVQHSQGLNFRRDCHAHFTAAPDYGSATVGVRKPQYLESSTGDDYSVSVFEVLRFSSGPIVPTPLLAHSSDLAGHLSEELDSAQALGYIAGQNRASSIIKDFPLVDHTRGYWDIQGHASGYITNPTYAMGQSSGYPQESGDVPIFRDLDNSFAGPTMCLGPIPSVHNCTSCQVIGSDAPWSRLSSPLLPSLRELHPSGDFTIDNIPPPPEQTQTEVEQWVTFPSNSTSYSTSDSYIASYPSFPMLNQNSSSWSPQEHLGYPVPIHPHYTRPVYLPDFLGFDTGSKMELRTLGILDDHAAQVLTNHPSHTLSDYKTHPFCDYATNIPDDHTTGGDDHGNSDESKFSSEQVVSLRPQSPPPLNQFPLSPRELHSHDRVSRIEGGSLSRTFHHTRRFATARSRLPTRLPKAPSVCYHNVSRPCGWRDDKGRECGMLINCGNRADHFAAAHGIKNEACHAKIICRWCPSEPQMAVKRKNFSRHVKEVHLGCPRFENGI